MGSFRFRLAGYFVLLTLLPVAGISWALSQVAARGETSRVDARLHAALRVAVAAYADDLTEAKRTADELAREPAVRRALAARSRKGLEGQASQAAFYLGDRLIAGTDPKEPAGVATADVLTRDGEALGRVVIWLPLDDAFVRELRRRAAIEPGDRLLLASGNRVVAGSSELEGVALELAAGSGQEVEVRDESFRAARLSLPGDERVSLVALAPSSAVDAAVGDVRERLLLIAWGAVVLVGLLAYLFARPIVRSLRELSDAARAVAQGRFERRVRVRGHDELAVLARAFNDMAAQLETRVEELAEERSRVQGAIDRLGTALSATHDPRTLLPVIVESAVEVTGAVGGRLLQDGSEVAAAGAPDPDREPLEIALGDAGGRSLLLLYPPERGFSDEGRRLAGRLARQAAVALENARLHRRVKRLAVTDGLTQLPNRRQFEEALAAEISRIERFGGSLGLIYADLDDFKRVNDRHGHQTGDDVLRAFADVLRRSVRDIDVPARYGGEEFAVLLPGTDLAGTERLAHRIRLDLAAEPVETVSGPLAVTASFGVAAFPEEPTQAELFAAADRALYQAKRSGKNRVVTARDEAAVRPDG